MWTLVVSVEEEVVRIGGVEFVLRGRRGWRYVG